CRLRETRSPRRRDTDFTDLASVAASRSAQLQTKRPRPQTEMTFGAPNAVRTCSQRWRKIERRQTTLCWPDTGLKRCRHDARLSVALRRWQWLLPLRANRAFHKDSARTDAARRLGFQTASARSTHRRVFSYRAEIFAHKNLRVSGCRPAARQASPLTLRSESSEPGWLERLRERPFAREC